LRTKSKNKEASMVVIAKIGNARVIEVAKNGIAKGYDNQIISDMTELSEEVINALREE
jgi:hypothetical protein